MQFTGDYGKISPYFYMNLHRFMQFSISAAGGNENEVHEESENQELSMIPAGYEAVPQISPMGDSTSIWMLALLMLASGLCLFVIVYLKKRRQEAE